MACSPSILLLCDRFPEYPLFNEIISGDQSKCPQEMETVYAIIVCASRRRAAACALRAELAAAAAK